MGRCRHGRKCSEKDLTRDNFDQAVMYDVRLFVPHGLIKSPQVAAAESLRDGKC